MKRTDGKGNGIDAALNARDDPNYARTVYDAYNDREVFYVLHISVLRITCKKDYVGNGTESCFCFFVFFLCEFVRFGTCSVRAIYDFVCGAAAYFSLSKRTSCFVLAQCGCNQSTSPFYVSVRYVKCMLPGM